MNEKLNLLIGAVIGASVGYFIGAVAAEVIAIKESAKDGYEDSEEFPQDGEDMDMEDEEYQILERKPRVKNKVKSVKKNYTEFFKSQGRPDLAELAAKYNGDEEKVVNAPARTEEEIEGLHDGEFESAEEENESKPIRIISLSEFANEEEFESVTLSYYDDDVLTDEHDNPIDRPERVVGEDALVSFGEQSEDSDVVYVRNETLRGVYEIVRTNKNYGATPERYARKKAVRKVEKEEENEEVDDN